MNKDILTYNGIVKLLGELENTFNIELRDTVSSTNALLKAKAEVSDEGETLIALSQTEGKGRYTRKFHSPKGNGIYMSILLKPKIPPQNAVQITTAAAVAVAEAIEKLTHNTAQIKWVNDVYIKGKKVSGILTEGAINPKTKMLDWAVLGIGINVYPPENGFESEIKDIAGAVSNTEKPDLLNRITAETLKNFYKYYKNLEQKPHLKEYQKRSLLNQKAIKVIKGEKVLNATALLIDDDFCLLVDYNNGTKEHLNSGEVSIKI